MFKINLNRNSNFLFISISSLIVFFAYIALLTDILNLFIYKINGESGHISKLSRLFLEILFVIMLLRKKIYWPLFFLLFFTTTNLLGMVLLYAYEGSVHISIPDILSNVVIVNKFFLFFLFQTVLLSCKYDSRFVVSMNRFFEFSYVLFSLSILMGFIFKLESLESYIGKARFGYKGLIVTQNEAVGLMLIGLFYFKMKFDVTNKTGTLVFMYVLYLSGLLVASKACLFFLTLAMVYFHMKLLSSKKALIVISLFIFGASWINWQEIISYYKITYDYFLYFYDSGDSFLSVMLTGRDWRVQGVFDHLRDGNHLFYNYIFGGFNFLKYGTEMDFFDILILFGISGVFYYSFYIYSIYRVPELKKPVVVFLLLFLTASFLGGHLIYNAIIPIYLAIFCVNISLKYRVPNE